MCLAALGDGFARPVRITAAHTAKVEVDKKKIVVPAREQFHGRLTAGGRVNAQALLLQQELGGEQRHLTNARRCLGGTVGLG